MQARGQSLRVAGDADPLAPVPCLGLDLDGAARDPERLRQHVDAGCVCLAIDGGSLHRDAQRVAMERGGAVAAGSRRHVNPEAHAIGPHFEAEGAGALAQMGGTPGPAARERGPALGPALPAPCAFAALFSALLA